MSEHGWSQAHTEVLLTEMRLMRLGVQRLGEVLERAGTTGVALAAPMPQPAPSAVSAAVRQAAPTSAVASVPGGSGDTAWAAPFSPVTTPAAADSRRAVAAHVDAATIGSSARPATTSAAAPAPAPAGAQVTTNNGAQGTTNNGAHVTTNNGAHVTTNAGAQVTTDAAAQGVMAAGRQDPGGIGVQDATVSGRYGSASAGGRYATGHHAPSASNATRSRRRRQPDMSMYPTAATLPAFAASLPRSAGTDQPPGAPGTSIPPVTRGAQAPGTPPEFVALPPTQATPRESWWARLTSPEGQRPAWLTPERVLGVAGSLVTLLGVVFMLVLGARHGLFGPGLRVTSLAALAVGLGIAAIRVRPRTVQGSVALAATSVSAMFLVVGAAGALYHWVPSWLALLTGSAIAAGGFWWATRWSSPLLAQLTLAEVALAAPAVVGFHDTATITLSCLFVLIASVSLAVISIRSSWPITGRVAGGVGLLFAVVPAFSATWYPGWHYLVVGLVMAVVLAAVAAYSDDLPGLVVALLLAQLSIGSLDERVEAFLPAVLCAVYALASRLLRDRRGHVLIAFAVLAGFHAIVLGAGAEMRGAAFAAAALALSLSGRRASSAMLTMLSWVAALVALVLGAEAAVSVTLAYYGAHSATAPVMLSALLLVAVALADMTSPVKVGEMSRRGRVTLGLVLALGSSAVVLVSASELMFGAVDGFSVGHVLTTVVWVVTGIALLLRRSALRLTGFVLAAVGVTKLFLFDLGAVDGWLRAVLFLAGGVALLVAAAQYRARNADDPRSTLERGEQPEQEAVEPAAPVESHERIEPDAAPRDVVSAAGSLPRHGG